MEHHFCLHLIADLPACAGALSKTNTVMKLIFHTGSSLSSGVT
jgi:hypothetical protein